MAKPGRTRTCCLICVLLVLAVLRVYWQAGTFRLTNYDDNQYVTQNRHIAGGLTTANIAWAFTSGHASNWHPLTWISHMADITLFGLHPQGHHLVSVGLHAANTLLLFLVLSMMTGFVWRSAFVAALFALHPLHVESVAWIAERKDVLSTFFWLLTMLAYVYYVRRPRITRYLLVLLPFALGLMSKPMLVSLPIVLLLLDYWPLGRIHHGNTKEGETTKQAPDQAGEEKATKPLSRSRPFGALAVEKALLFALAAVSCVVTYLVQKRGGAMYPLDQFPLGTRLANALVSYTGYVWKMVWPAKLAPFYPHALDSLPIWKVAGSGLLLVCLTYLSIRTRRRRPYVLMGWLWYVVTLIPVIGLVQVGSQSMADRYTYVPLVGLFIILAWGIGDLMLQRARVAAGLAVIVLLGLSVCAHRQAGYWRDTVTLFRHALAVTPDNTVARCNLAAGLQEVGRLDEAAANYRHVVRFMPGQWQAEYGLGVVLSQQRKLDEAIACYGRALDLKPEYAVCRYNLGVALYEKGDLDGAASQYERSLAIDPSDPRAHNNLAKILEGRGMLHEAIGHYREALKIDPANVTVRRNLSSALKGMGKLERAAGRFRKVATHNPRDWRVQHDLGVALAREGKLDEAIACYRRSLSINPNYAPDRYNLAVALQQKGDLNGAAAEYRRALALDPSNSAAHSNLGVILVRWGMLDQAIAHLREAVRLKPDSASARNNLALALEMKADKGR